MTEDQKKSIKIFENIVDLCKKDKKYANVFLNDIEPFLEEKDQEGFFGANGELNPSREFKKNKKKYPEKIKKFEWSQDFIKKFNL